MIGMICILAGIAPADVHLACRQINDHGVDGFLAIEWVGTIDVVIANRVWQINMIFLDSLQSLDRVR